MPRITKNDVPKALRPFLFHGIRLENLESEQAIGDCPFCPREGRFYVNTETGQWDCKFCQASGNTKSFLEQLWQAYSTKAAGNGEREITTKGREALARNRKLIFSSTLERWGIVKSGFSGEWLIPGFRTDGKVGQLYRYSQDIKSGRYYLKATPGISHQILGLNLYNPKASTIYLCEGIWDALVLWELLSNLKENGDGGLTITGSEMSSLLSDACVLATPSCNVFQDEWGELFADKDIILLYDSDYPDSIRRVSAGYLGMKTATRKMLHSRSNPPAKVFYLRWGDLGYDPELPSGYDIRDFLTTEDPEGETSPAQLLRVRGRQLQKLVEMMEPIPGDWIGGRSKTSVVSGSTKIEPVFCASWDRVVNAWRKAMLWTPGLDKALSVMLASIISTEVKGDQLWVKIMGPASCGKSTLCEALAVNGKYVVAKSSIRGFHSGFKTDGAGSEDNSLISKLYGKTLVTKDGDTLLQSPNLQQILSEARDLYDCTARTHYRNKVERDYQGVRMTWILCGTSSLRYLDTSELGERFLDCVIMEDIDEDLEYEIMMRVAYRAERDVGSLSNGKAETQYSPELVEAYQLTAGYITYLRENAEQLISKVNCESNDLFYIAKLAKMVSYLRARPSPKQEEKAEREFSARLVSQLVRLSKCLGAVLNSDTVCQNVLNRVHQVAFDTARGRTLDIVKVLRGQGNVGASINYLAAHTGQTVDKERTLLRFLKRIKVVEIAPEKKVAGITIPGSMIRWRLTDTFRKLYNSVRELPGKSVNEDKSLLT